MRRARATALLSGLFVVVACAAGPHARCRQSFDELAARLDGMTAAEVARTIGPPDSRQPVYLRDERWIWWNFTFLDGENYPPEVRGQVVHLEITFRNPAGAGDEPHPVADWRVAHPFGIAYRSQTGQAVTSAAIPTPAGHGG